MYHVLTTLDLNYYTEVVIFKRDLVIPAEISPAATPREFREGTLCVSEWS